MGPSSIYLKRRQKLASQLGNGVAIIHSGALKMKNATCEYRFRVDSNFYYLCGLSEENAVLVVCARDGQYECSVLFVEQKGAEFERWNGPRMTPAKCVSELGMDQAYVLKDLESKLGELWAGKETLWSSKNDIFLNKVLAGNKRLNSVQSRDLTGVLGPMRAYKDKYEIEQLKKAASAAELAHKMAQAMCRPGISEGQLHGVLEYAFKAKGAFGEAYSSIVAGGENATILHYIKNDSLLNDGQLCLIDAGAEYNFYASDITRTFPVNGTFTGPQKELYQLVLEAQKKVIDQIAPGGSQALNHRVACEVLIAGLVDLKILKGSVDGLYESGAHRPFYPHATGHWLGLDTHDCSPAADSEKNKSFEFRPSMVMTVEPGLYFPSHRAGIPEQFKGVGIRIEDDVLVTATGCEVLSVNIPKEIGAIEEQCRCDARELFDA